MHIQPNQPKVPENFLFRRMDNTTSFVFQLSDQDFLPYQFEVTLVPFFHIGLLAAAAFSDSKWKEAIVYSYAFATFALLLAFSPQGPYFHPLSALLRLPYCALGIYAAISDPPKTWDRGSIAFAWVSIDPLSWIVELAIMLQFDQPIFLIFWSVRQAAIVASFSTIFYDEQLKDSQKVWTFMMAAIVIAQIILNEENPKVVFFKTFLPIGVNHMLGNNGKARGDEVIQNKFLSPIIANKVKKMFLQGFLDGML